MLNCLLCNDSNLFALLRVIVLFATLLSALSTKSFAQVIETFSDGDLTNNPTWSGDLSSWTINGGQLQSNGPAVADTIYLSTPSPTVIGQWEFFVNPKLNTTSGNLMEVHLMSDNANLSLPHDGYFVRIGNTTDEISLYRKQGATETEIIDGPDTVTVYNDNPTKVKVLHDASFTWTLFLDSTGTGANYVNIGSVMDATIFSSQYFGVLAKYSGSNSTKYFFDDLYAGPVVVDNEPPQILSATVITPTQLDLQFSEPLDQTSAETESNYTINNAIGNPLSATLDANTSLVHLVLSTALANQSYEIIANNIGDLNGNVLTADTATFSFYQTLAGDVVINELMADPDPAIGLPSAEFVELFNTTSQDIDITNWTITDGSSVGTIPSFVLPANGFVILTTTTSQGSFTAFGTAIGVSSFPSLNNSGDHLQLKTQNGLVVDDVNYTDDWYNDASKADGGWTLERKNPFTTCGGANNWSASTNPIGGTPGSQNSIFDSTPDVTAPQIISATAVASDTIIIVFNETLDSLQVATDAVFDVEPGIGNAVSVSVAAPDFNVVTIVLPALLQVGNDYTIFMTNVSDCADNIAATLTFEFTLPDTASPNDLVINEILFNPATFGYDYVEIYNNSSKTIDASQLKLWNTDITGQPEDFTLLSDLPRTISPNGFLLITEDTTFVLNNYPTHDATAFVQVDDLPSYNDDAGTVILTNAHDVVIDKLAYSDEWQYALLEDVNGVSLERISPDAPTQDSMNWHSAATSVGYGTPGLANSQFIPQLSDPVTDVISLVPRVFSPDGDGYNDVLMIRYNFDSLGYTMNVKIFNEAGEMVNDLVEGRLAEPDGFATWDGNDARGERAAVGPYVIWIEAFRPDGTVKQFKRTCVLAGKKS